jgi:hypothetical protein
MRLTRSVTPSLRRPSDDVATNVSAVDHSRGFLCGTVTGFSIKVQFQERLNLVNF